MSEPARPLETDLLSRVGGLIDAHALLPRGAGVLAAVSGGRDSVVLLDILRRLAPQRGWRLTVAHLDHALRAGSAEDARFVAELAGRWALPVRIERRDARAHAERDGESLETAARTQRYAFLLTAARDLGARYVALGHHADDQAETVLHRIVRGTHLRGLAGMPLRRAISESEVTLVRPLLRTPRSAIVAFAVNRGLPWREDPSNAELDNSRNMIRHEVLPRLAKRLNPRVDEALLRLAAAAGEAEAFLAERAAELLEGTEAEVRPLREAPALLQRMALRELLERNGVGMRHIGAEHIERLRALLAPAGPAGASLPGGVELRRSGMRLRVVGPEEG